MLKIIYDSDTHLIKQNNKLIVKVRDSHRMHVHISCAPHVTGLILINKKHDKYKLNFEISI